MVALPARVMALVCVALLALASRGEAAPLPFEIPSAIARVPSKAIVDAQLIQQLAIAGYTGVILRDSVDLRAAALLLRDSPIKIVFIEVVIKGDSTALLEDKPDVSAIQTASTLANELGYTGLLLNVATSAPLFEPARPLYTQHNFRPAILAERARQLGSAVAGATASGLEILVIASDIEAIAPLWWPWIDGMLSEASRGSDRPIHIAIPPGKGKPADLIERWNQLVYMHVSDGAWGHWLQAGSLVLPFNSANSFETIAVKSIAQRYVWSPLPRPESGRIITLPNAATAIDTFTRAGSHCAFGSKLVVFTNNEGAAVLAVDGIPEPISVTGAGAAVAVTNLSTGERTELPRSSDSIAIGPMAAPALIENLPLRDWIPTSFYFRPDVPLLAGTTITPVKFGWTNATNARMEGSLVLVPPDRFAASPATLPVALDARQTLHAHGAVTGAARAGETISFKLVLATPESKTVSRTFEQIVLPRYLWKHSLYEPMQPNWIAADVNPDGVSELLGLTATGSLLCADPDGNELWITRETGLLFKPATGRYWNKTSVVACVDAGALRVFDRSGFQNWSHDFDTPPSCSPLFANLHPRRGEESVVGLADGRVVALAGSGKDLWTGHVAAPVVSIVPVYRADSRNDIAVVSGSTATELTLVDPLGHTVITMNCADSVTSSPLVFHGDTQRRILVGLKNGSVMTLDPDTGDQSTVRVAEFAIIHVVAGTTDTNAFVIGATANEVIALDENLKKRWSMPVKVAGAPVVWPASQQPIVMAPTRDEGIVAFDLEGRRLWNDLRIGFTIASSPVVCELDGDPQPELFCASPDGLTMALDATP